MWQNIKRTPEVLYHYTKKENVEKIINDGTVKKFKDSACWFAESLEDTLKIMKHTVMNEGAYYFNLYGRPEKYKKFNPDEYVILKVNPKYDNPSDWYIYLSERGVFNNNYKMSEDCFIVYCKIKMYKVASVKCTKLQVQNVQSCK